MTKAMILACIVSVGLGLSLMADEPDKKSAAGDKPKWKELFDGKSLDGWKSSEFTGTGKITLQDGAVVMEKGNDMTGITYNKKDFPTIDYEVTLEGKRIDGDDFFCTTTFPVGDEFCSFVVGGWGGTVVGISSVNFNDASMNETTTSREFQRGRWYQVRIRVTKNRIQAWIDNERQVDLDTEDKKLSIRSECNRSKPFGIATWRTSGAVRNIKLRMLTEAEKK
jgi:hypothetical protein